MPVYEYQCKNCGVVVEREFKIAEKPQELEDEHCEHCDEDVTFKAILSPTGLSGLQDM